MRMHMHMRLVAQLLAVMTLGGALPLCGETAVRQLRPARLSQLAAGIRVPARVGFRVDQLKIGRVDVKGLFVIAGGGKPSTATYYLGPGNDILIRVRDELSLQELRAIALVKEGVPLEVVLRDDTKSRLLALYERWRLIFPSPILQRVVQIPIDLDPISTCDKVTRIFYHGIDSILRTEIRKAGQTSAQVRLDAVYALLLKEKIEPFLASLDPVARNNPCFGTFALLKWLRNEKVEGFEFGKYTLHSGLRGILSGVSDSLLAMRPQLYHIEIEVIGFADPTPIKETSIPLQASASGVNYLTNIGQALNVYYEGCSGDALSGSAPRLIDFGAGVGSRVVNAIKNNCELGAVRAYVAAAYMMGRLGTAWVAYRYGTGGVLRMQGDDLRKRRVEVKIKVKSASKDSW
jgi:hypothetical protein